MIISAQSYTIRNFLKTQEDIEKSITKLKEIGFNNLQISGFGDYDVDWLKDLLLKLDMTVCATHTPLDRILNDTDNVIKEHLKLNIPYVGLGYTKFSCIDEVKKHLTDLSPVIKKIKDNGLKFIHHNHHHEFIPLDGKVCAMNYILENTSPDEYGLLPDTYWLQVSGLSPAKFIKDNADRIDVIHLKDMSLDSEGKQIFSEVYNGNIDFDEIIKTAQSVGVSYAAIEQDSCYGKDPFDSLKTSLNNILSRNILK